LGGDDDDEEDDEDERGRDKILARAVMGRGFDE
jgi:hypothetical protein